jgi:hypothetical protein
MIKPSRADLFQLSSCLYALTKNVVHMLPFRQVTLNQMLARERTGLRKLLPRLYAPDLGLRNHRFQGVAGHVDNRIAKALPCFIYERDF